jgi:hypothetical protein
MTGQAVSVAANATSSNQVAGLLYEFLRRRSSVLLAACSSAVGINCTLIIGGRVMVNDSPISQANRYPLLPDDVVTQETGNAGDRIILTFRNTTGGALTVNWTMDVA